MVQWQSPCLESPSEGLVGVAQKYSTYTKLGWIPKTHEKTKTWWGSGAGHASLAGNGGIPEGEDRAVRQLLHNSPLRLLLTPTDTSLDSVYMTGFMGLTHG